MATHVFVDPSGVFNSVDLSAYIRSIALNYEADTPEDTAAGSAAERSFLAGGLTTWSIDVEYNQDYAAAKVDATLFSLLGTSFTTTLKPTSAGVGPTNPSFAGSTILTSYPPLGGTVGDTHTTSVRMQGTGTLTRATA